MRVARAVIAPAVSMNRSNRCRLPLFQPVNDEVCHQLAMRAPQGGRQEITAEDRAERVQIGYVEEAQCAHQHMHVDRLHFRDEASFAAPAFQADGLQ